MDKTVAEAFILAGMTVGASTVTGAACAVPFVLPAAIIGASIGLCAIGERHTMAIDNIPPPHDSIVARWSNGLPKLTATDMVIRKPTPLEIIRVPVQTGLTFAVTPVKAGAMVGASLGLVIGIGLVIDTLKRVR